jgi:hypothetical protein
MKTTQALAFSALLLFAGCSAGGDDSEDESPRAALDPDAPPVTEGSWYRPAADVTWQWQLDGEIHLAYDVEIYDVDLFETPDAVIEALHEQGRRVVCYFSAGSGENYRDDYDGFLQSDLGRTLDDWPNERWLDVRSQTVLDVMLARLDLAVERGCDGVEPDNVDGFTNDTGFDLTARDQLAFNRHIANEAHRRGLAIALKNDGDQAAGLVDYYDLALNEECHAYEECEQFEPFTDRGIPVLNAEYADDVDAARAMESEVCRAARAEGLQTLILPYALDDAFRIACF